LADLTAELIRSNRILFYARNRLLIAENALVGTAGVGEENGDNEWPGSGFWPLVTGHWLLVSGCWLLVTGLLSLVTDFWSLVTDLWSLVFGGWK
jgi:hypothetical protein